MTSLYEVLKRSKTAPQLAPDMFTALWAKSITAGKTIELSGQVPLSFKANGKPLLDFLISGNTVQSGTPTPDNPIMPQGIGERTENLFDISSKKTIGGKVAYDCPLTIGTEYTFTNCSEYVLGFKISNWPTAAYSVQKESLQPGESYIFTMTLNPNLPPGTTQYFFIIFNSVYGAAVNDGYVMLNTGSTPLPYEPYGVKIPISSASTTTPVYLGEVETTRRVKKLVFTGNEDWTAGGGNSRYIISVNNIQNYAICSHFAFGDSLDSNEFDVVPNRLQIRFNNAGYTTTEDWKSYLQQQYAAGTPVTVWYVLANEETAVVNEPLMKIGDYADTLSMEQAGVQIPTNKGSTTLDVLTTVKPSNVSIKYRV